VKVLVKGEGLETDRAMLERQISDREDTIAKLERQVQALKMGLGELVIDRNKAEAQSLSLSNFISTQSSEQQNATNFLA
jgi:uncharacterized protein (DUF3084 family)